MKEPVRLGKVENTAPLMDFEMWILLHPSAVIMGMGITLLILGALVFAVTGHSAVESGGMRNFIANGV